MGHYSRYLLPQPAVSIVVSLIALTSLGAAALRQGTPSSFAQFLPILALAAVLLGAIVLSYLFPIHVGHSTKIYLSSVPLFLLAALSPVAVAATAAGLGILAGELAVRKARNTYPSDIATTSGRLTLAALLAACVAHQSPPGSAWHLAGLLVAALVCLAADTLTAPLAIAPMCKERPIRVLATIVRQGSVLEGAQYLLAVPSALVVAAQPWALALLIAPIALIYRHFKRVKELHAETRRLLEYLADSVDQRDTYTGSHSRRVATLADAMLKSLPLGGPEAELIVAAARVHDIGKIDIPIHLLQKAGALTVAEHTLMQRHADRGAELLRAHPGFGRMAEMVRCHHEAWDGTGYPRGLRGAAIPFGARVLAVADSYDAMTSDRPYRTGMAPMQAVDRLVRGRGGQWDPAIVDALIRALPALIQNTAHGSEQRALEPIRVESLAIAW